MPSSRGSWEETILRDSYWVKWPCLGKTLFSLLPVLGLMLMREGCYTMFNLRFMCSYHVKHQVQVEGGTSFSG